MRLNRATEDVDLRDVVVVDKLGHQILCERPGNDQVVIIQWIAIDLNDAFLWTGKKLDQWILQELTAEANA